MDKNGHFPSHPKIIISSLTVCLSKMSSILIGGTLHAQLQDCGFNSSGWHIPVIAQKRWGCFSLFFPWLIVIFSTFLTPPPPTSLKTSKQWVSSGGGLGGSGPKTHWGDVFIVQNNDFTRGETNDPTP